RTVDVAFSRRRVRHRDAYEAPAAPGRAAHPARALVLDPLDDGVRAGVVTEPDQDLVEDDVVVDRRTPGLETIGHPAGEGAAPVHEVGDALRSQLKKSRPYREAPSPPARLRREITEDIVRARSGAGEIG